MLTLADISFPSSSTKVKEPFPFAILSSVSPFHEKDFFISDDGSHNNTPLAVLTHCESAVDEHALTIERVRHITIMYFSFLNIRVV